MEKNLDLAQANLVKLEDKAGGFLTLTWVSFIVGAVIIIFSITTGVSSFDGLFGSGAEGFMFFGIVLLQMSFIFAVGYIFTSTMARHAAVNFHIANSNKE